MPRHPAFPTVRAAAAQALLTALLSAFLLSACVEESVLSDGHLTDAKLVRPIFELEKTRGSSSTSYLFRAELQDRKGDPVEIMDGAIYLNGVKMNVEHEYFGDLPYYTLSSSKIKFKLDSVYTFTVVLSDGAEYASWVRTQKYDIASTTVKKSNGVASITWSGDHVNPITVHYTLYQDSVEIQKSMTYLPRKNPDTIRVYMEGMKNIRYSLGTIRTGAVNAAFRNGGQITSKINATW